MAGLYTSRPERPKTYQPRAKRSDALGRELSRFNSQCFALAGLDGILTFYPGRRFALPWANMWLPFQGDYLCRNNRVVRYATAARTLQTPREIARE